MQGKYAKLYVRSVYLWLCFCRIIEQRGMADGVREKIKQSWQALTIKKKIATFTGTVFLIIALSVLFNVWVVKFSLIDFNMILQDNAAVSELGQALEEESIQFEAYIKSSREERESLDDAMERTKKAVDKLPFSYSGIGERRYAKTWSIKSCYEVYCQKRDAMLAMGENAPDYIKRLYEVYEMHDYLEEYAATLMNETIEDGDGLYHKKVPMLICMPIVVVVSGIILVTGMMELAALMNQTIISPVVALVKAAQRIAANDFFSEDVQVQNEDELGELVHAFNKMKYATGEYIMALEEKRKTLDLLHEEELEKLETEKRLEMIKLELLKSQINPHFLFNTLNVISGMARLEEAQTTEKMILALSSLFRYNLKTPEQFVLLAKELNVAADYMYLQQMRFGERIRYELDCKARQELVMVPAFTFQPLVENAIIHGIAPKEEGGSIRIVVRQKENRLRIAIGDDGIGMTDEELQQLKNRLKTTDAGHGGIGLGNVYRRITAMYPDGDFEICSKKDAGTVIVIDIPCREETGDMT